MNFFTRACDYTTSIYRWDNIPRATVEGLEGYLNLPLVADKLSLDTNFTYLRKSVKKPQVTR